MAGEQPAMEEQQNNDAPINNDGALPFADGFPTPKDTDLLAVIEQMIIQRAKDRGITTVGLNDASMPVTAALRREALLPVIVDYLTHTIFEQSELNFDAEFIDRMTLDVLEQEAANDADGNNQESVGDAQNRVKKMVQTPLLYNENDDDGLLFARTSVAKAATIPVSASLLMVDTALESAHNLSVGYQQTLMGEATHSELDLTPVMNVLESLDVSNRVIAPAALHIRLEELRQKAVTGTATFGYEEPVEPLDTFNDDADSEALESKPE